MTIIATWNVNSVRARLPRVLEWLDDFNPDIALLQELKATEETFPKFEIEERGYHIEIHGQKGFNGVGILSKKPIKNVIKGIPNNKADEQARYIEGTIDDLRVASIYLPNGNPAPGDKFDYKIQWMEHLHDHMKRVLKEPKAVIFGGDYNIVPADEGSSIYWIITNSNPNMHITTVENIKRTILAR